MSETPMPVVISRRTMVELKRAIYDHHGWRRKAGESMSGRIGKLYSIWPDHATGWWTATPRNSPAQTEDSPVTCHAFNAGGASDIAAVTERIGAWLSAALEDPSTCQEMRDDILAWMTAGQPNVPPARQNLPLLAADHTGMRVDYSGLLRQTREALEHGEKEPALAEMLRQLQGHITELGRRWYAGDALVVDELLQLYCVEDEAREALATGGVSDAADS